MDIQKALNKAWQKYGVLPYYQRYQDQAHATLVDVLEFCMASFADLPAFTCLGKTITYKQLDLLSNRFAAYLQQYTELESGDRIAVQLPNVLQYPVVAIGALRAGLVVVNTNPMYTHRELRHQLCDSGAKALVLLDSLSATAREVLPETAVKTVFSTRLADLHPFGKRQLLQLGLKLRGKGRKGPPIAGQIDLRRVLTCDYPTADRVRQGGGDIAMLQYTGGTTGVAKGAMLSHDNLKSNLHQSLAMLEAGGFRETEETMIAPLPLYHIYGFMLSVLVCMRLGGHAILLPDPRKLDTYRALLKKYPVTIFPGLNTLFLHLLQHKGFGDSNFKDIKLVLSGGMALSQDVAARWREITGLEICEGYGLTETSPVVSLSLPHLGAKRGYVGISLPGQQIRVVDESGKPLETNQTGELCVRGPQVMQGYWQRPDETDKVVVDGWLHTGDIALVDDDAFIRIVDRKKDVIIVSGFNVYPNEIEDVLDSHPDISYSAVIGMPDADTGEAIHAFVVADNPGLTADGIRDWCHRELTGYKVPKYIEFRSELPRSNVGKVLRAQLRKELTDAIAERRA